MKYTVILAYEDRGSTVDWVEATTPRGACFKSQEMEGREDGWPVAVFEGHLYDVGDLGNDQPDNAEIR